MSAEDVEDVRREISILHHLGDHPNVVELIDAYEQVGNQLYRVCETFDTDPMDLLPG